MSSSESCSAVSPAPPVPIPLPVVRAKELADMVRTDFGWPADSQMTCEDCLSNAECEYAFDPYNFNGDCLAIK